MPKCSEALVNARREEIIRACAQLYGSMSFKEITIKDIGAITSFTRTSIYNYFQTKEEIFMALFQKEYELWSADLEKLCTENETMTPDRFADAMARILEKRELLLRMLGMNLCDMENSSRIENLVDFKKAYGRALTAVRNCLEKFFPQMSVHEIQDFLYAFFPFLFGVYPYVHVTKQQKRAMELADTDFVFLSIYEIVNGCVRKLLGVKI